MFDINNVRKENSRAVTAGLVVAVRRQPGALTLQKKQ